MMDIDTTVLLDAVYELDRVLREKSYKDDDRFKSETAQRQLEERITRARAEIGALLDALAGDANALA